MTTPDGDIPADEPIPDAWPDLTAALDAMNRDAMNREAMNREAMNREAMRRELAKPIGGMFMNDRIAFTTPQVGGFEIPPDPVDLAALRRALDEQNGERDDDA